MRLRYAGAVGRCLASSDRYKDPLLPPGRATGTPADALDRAC
jgi:hypothetical protein